MLLSYNDWSVEQCCHATGFVSQNQWDHYSHCSRAHTQVQGTGSCDFLSLAVHKYKSLKDVRDYVMRCTLTAVLIIADEQNTSYAVLII